MPKIEVRTVSVYAFRLAKEGPEYLALHRRQGLDLGDTWQAVHGRIDPAETAVQAAWREVGEETGLTPIGFWSLDFIEQFYVAEIDTVELVPCFAAQLKGPIALGAEHDDYRWMKLEEILRAFVWPGQREALRTLHFEIALPLFEGRPINPFLEISPERQEGQAT